MTDSEKVEALKGLCEDSSAYADSVYLAYLNYAGQKILNRRFPFDKESRSGAVPNEYVYTQIELACAMLMKRGAEGESEHSENGVKRTYRSEDDILSDVVPYVGVL